MRARKQTDPEPAFYVWLPALKEWHKVDVDAAARLWAEGERVESFGRELHSHEIHNEKAIA